MILMEDITYDGMWENNLYNFMRQVMPKLVSGLKRPFRLEGMYRDDDTPVHKAIREAMANMMIHSDYMITGILKIVKLDNAYIFSNPGSLKLPVQDIYEGGHSVARNPHIQTFFRMIGAGDNIGSGFPTILNAWGEENWRQPDLCEDADLRQVELKLWMVSLMPQECTEHLNALYGAIYSHLTNNEQIILGTAYLEGAVTNTRLQSMLNLHSTEIGRILSGLVERKLLIVDKKGRWTSYQLNEKFELTPEQLYLSDVPTEEEKFNSESARKIYEYARENRFITTAQVLQITKINTRQGALFALNKLIERGLLRKTGKGKSTSYEFVK